MIQLTDILGRKWNFTVDVEERPGEVWVWARHGPAPMGSYFSPAEGAKLADALAAAVTAAQDIAAKVPA